jgi:hypothetical protein
MASLIRVGDGEGFAGSRVDAIKWDKEKDETEVVGHRPTVGCALLVGSLTAGTYSSRDWWMTTEITEILEETEEKGQLYVKFKTGNSIYEFWT